MTNLDTASGRSESGSGTTFFYEQKPYSGIYEKETKKLFVPKTTFLTTPNVGSIIEIDGGIPKITTISEDHAKSHYILQLK
jgi:hypothetical protein